MPPKATADDLENLVNRITDLNLAPNTSTTIHITIINSAPEGASKAAPKPKPKAKATGKIRYYAVTSVPRDQEDFQGLLGIWHCIWHKLESELPTGQLCGSRCHVRGFDSLDAATAYWHAKGWKTEPTLLSRTDVAEAARS